MSNIDELSTEPLEHPAEHQGLLLQGAAKLALAASVVVRAGDLIHTEYDGRYWPLLVSFAGAAGCAAVVLFKSGRDDLRNRGKPQEITEADFQMELKGLLEQPEFLDNSDPSNIPKLDSRPHE